MISTLGVSTALADDGNDNSGNNEPAVDFSAESFFNSLNLDYPGLESVRTAVNAKDYAAAEAAYLDFRKKPGTPHAAVDPQSRPQTATEDDDAAADQVIAHTVTGPYHLDPNSAFIGNPINWQFNPLSSSDPKYTKEWTWCYVARTYFWSNLASAYWKTLDEKYAKEWISELKSFVSSNPVPEQAPGNATWDWRVLDAGIRMANVWPDVYSRFLSSPNFTPEDNAIYAQSVLDHCHRLAYGIKLGDTSGNWLATEANGLAYASILFPEFKEASAFRQIAFDTIHQELTRQVYPDGSQIELTPMYENVALDDFVAAYRLAQSNGVPPPAEDLAAIHRMFRFLVGNTAPDGSIPPHNDSKALNGRGLATEALATFPADPDFTYLASHSAQGPKPPLADAFPWSGFYIMRSGWEPDDAYLRMNAGPLGVGHFHEDDLGIVLYALGKHFIDDPGNYDYDQSEWREYVISTKSHSTVIVDGKDQCRQAGPRSDAPTGDSWMTSPVIDYSAGTYDAGYQEDHYVAKGFFPLEFVGDVDKSVTHTRHVIFLKPGYFLVVDELTGSGDHQFQDLFQLDAPSAEIDPISQTVYSQEQGSAQLALIPLDLDHLSVNIAQGLKDPLMGWIPSEHRAIPTVIFSKKQECPARFATLLLPYKDTKPTFSSQTLGDDPSVWGCQIKTDSEEDDVYLPATAQKMRAADITATAALLVLRRSAGQPDRGAAYGLKELAFGEGTVAFDAPASINWTHNNAKLSLYNAGDTPIKATWTKAGATSEAFNLPAGQWTSP